MRRPIFVLAFTLLLAPAVHAAMGGHGSCLADINGDGIVDVVDFGALSSAFGTADPNADLNANGIVGNVDLAILAEHFGEPCPTCRADFDGDGDVDAADRAKIVADFGLDCRADLDHDGTVGGDGDSGDAAIVGKSFGFADPDSDPKADLNRDGRVSLADFAIVGQQIGRDCRADLNWDGVVERADVQLLLDNKGACP
jgi:hypothetical protein